MALNVASIVPLDLSGLWACVRAAHARFARASVQVDIRAFSPETVDVIVTGLEEVAIGWFIRAAFCHLFTASVQIGVRIACCIPTINWLHRLPLRIVMGAQKVLKTLSFF